MRILKFLWCVYRAYRLADEYGSGYVGACRNGVPEIACFVAFDREAWRVSRRAIEEFELKKVR